MGIFDTYAKRRQAKEKPVNDVYQYDKFSETFRVQVIHIWQDAIGGYYQRDYWDSSYHHVPNNNDAWKLVHQILTREFGVFELADGKNPYEECHNFLINSNDSEKILSLIEITFRYIERMASKFESYEKERLGIKQTPSDAISELNTRFFEHSFGFQYENGEIVRVDSTHSHNEIIKPALQLLHGKEFKGAEEEFRKAFDHYQHGRQKEALNESLKSFESTMKAICDIRKWEYPKNITSSGLITLLFNKGLIPTELQAHFTSLKSTLESGIPTVRNAKGGHGQGMNPITVPNYLVSYGINLAASAILLLVRAHEETK